MLILNRPLAYTDNDNGHSETLVQRQAKAYKSYDTLRNYNSIPIGSTIAVHSKDKGL